MDESGIVLLKNAPKSKGIVSKIVDKISYIRNTMYGPTWFVESVTNPNNIAYTSKSIPLHQDLLYYESPPGLQLLHCLRFDQAIGGQNTFVDGFKVSQDIFLSNREAFDILVKNKIYYHKKDEEKHIIFAYNFFLKKKT